MIIDYSTARPSIATLKSAGVTAVGRYIGWDSVPGYQSIAKNIAKPEAQALIGAGFQIFLSFEYAADAALQGAEQGSKDAALATIQLAALGAPSNMAVYFALDFDVPDYAPELADTPVNALAKLGPVGKYFQGIHSTHPLYEVGVYGGYWPLKRLFDAGLVSKGWQTIAWSGGMLDPSADIYQVPSTLPASLASAGIDSDIREHNLSNADYGQWPRPSSKPSAPKLPSGSGMPLIFDGPNSLAYVLPIPAGKSKVILYADDLGGEPPVIRIGFGPSWSKVEAKPTWDNPVVISAPAGEQRITIARLDSGKVPVTVDFA